LLIVALAILLDRSKKAGGVPRREREVNAVKHSACLLMRRHVVLMKLCCERSLFETQALQAA